MNRELDGKIAEDVFGWEETDVGPDIDGEHACSILTENGRLPEDISLPRKGEIGRAYLVPNYSLDLKLALRLLKRLKPDERIGDVPLDPEVIARRCYEFYQSQTNEE